MILRTVDRQQLEFLATNPNEFWKDINRVEQKAFFGMEELEEIKIPNTVKTIGAHAFSRCVNLKNVQLPQYLDYIGYGVFSKTSLTNVKLPKTIFYIDKYAFFNCTDLQDVKLNEGLAYIEESSFEGCVKLTEVKLPSTVVSIGYKAFRFCTSLQSIEIPDGVTVFRSSFSGCENLRNIKIGNITINIPQNDIFSSIASMNDGNYCIMTTSKTNQNQHNMILTNEETYYVIENVPESVYNNEKNIDYLLPWCNVKQKSPYKSVQNAKIPAEYLLKTLGTNEELINAYYQTRSNGMNILEEQPWFRALHDINKEEMIMLFIHLGGFEDNAAYQARVLQFMNKYNRDLVGLFQDLSLNTYKNTQSSITEYAHDKDNNLIIENGFPVIKNIKTVKYHKQILSILENNFQRPEFRGIAHDVVTDYPSLYKTYRKTLKDLNPARNPNGNKERYEILKQKGLDFNFINAYFNNLNQNLYIENEELKKVIYELDPYARKQEIVSSYDAYLTEAKQITQNAISQNRRVKVFLDNVVDNSYQGLKYIWPPITSAVALTIGDRFQTCYRVNGMNEAGLITVLTSPKDNLLLIYDETNHPIAYCRISYDEENKGILIDNIELDKNMLFDDKRKLEIWNTCVRALKDMKNAMNKEGVFLVERIHCKHDLFNKVYKVIEPLYPKIENICFNYLEERQYKTDRNVLDKEYGDMSYGVQIVIDGPEYEEWLENQTER